MERVGRIERRSICLEGRRLSNRLRATRIGDLDWTRTSMLPLCRRPPNYLGHKIEVERNTGFEPVRTSLAMTSRAKLNSA